MNKQDIERMARAWQEVTEKTKRCCKDCGDEFGKPTTDCKNDCNDPNGSHWETVDEAKMDPVNKMALKGKHADRKDKDIDNDGDVDSSDKYLHKRRQAITKNTNKSEGYYKDMEIKRQDKEMGAKPVSAKKKKSGETAIMNPKMDTAKGSSKGSEMEQKESRIRTALKSVLSEKAAHSPNKDKAEKIDDKIIGAGAKQMQADLTAKEKEKITDYDKLGHDDAAAAGRAGPSTKMRPNDNKQGDKKVVNPVAGVVTKEK